MDEGRNDESETSPQSLSNERIYERIQRNFEMQKAIKAGQALRSPRSPRETNPTSKSSSQLAWQGPSEEEDLPLPPPSSRLQRLTAAAAAADAPPLSSSQSPQARPGLLYLDGIVDARVPDAAQGTRGTRGNHRGDVRDDHVMPPERMKHGEGGTHFPEDDIMFPQRSRHGEKEKGTHNHHHHQQQQQQQKIRSSSSSPQPGGPAPYASGGYPRWAETKEPIEVHQDAGVGQASPDAAASAGKSKVHWQHPQLQKVDSVVLSRQEQDAIREILRAKEHEGGNVAPTREGGTVDGAVTVQPPHRVWQPAENQERESGHEHRGQPGAELERKLSHEHRETREVSGHEHRGQPGAELERKLGHEQRETREEFEGRVREGVGLGYEQRVTQAKRERYLQQAAEQRERDEALAMIRASRSQRMAGDGGSLDRGEVLGEAPRYHEAMSSAHVASTRRDDHEDAGDHHRGAGMPVGRDGRSPQHDAASSSPPSSGNGAKSRARCVETQTPPQLATTETQTWPNTLVTASNLHSSDRHQIRVTASPQNATASFENSDGAYVPHQSPRNAVRDDVLLGSPTRQDASVHHHHHHSSVIHHHSPALLPDGHHRLQASLREQGSPTQDDLIRSPKHGRLHAGQFASSSPGHVRTSPGHVHASPGHVHASKGHARPEVSEGVVLGGSLMAHAPDHAHHRSPCIAVSSAPSNVVLLPVILPGSKGDRISDLYLASAAHEEPITSTGEHYANLSQHLAMGGNAVYQTNEYGEDYRARENVERHGTPRGEESLRGGGAGSFGLYGSERLVRRPARENWGNHHGSRSEDMYTSERLVRRSPREVRDSYRESRRGDMYSSERLVRGSPRRVDRFRDREYGRNGDIGMRRDGIVKRNWVDDYQGYDRHEFCSVCKDAADEVCSLGCGAALCEVGENCNFSKPRETHPSTFDGRS